MVRTNGSKVLTNGIVFINPWINSFSRSFVHFMREKSRPNIYLVQSKTTRDEPADLFAIFEGPRISEGYKLERESLYSVIVPAPIISAAASE